MRKFSVAIATIAFSLLGARTALADGGGYLGIYLVDDSSGTRGAYVEDVAPDSPAEKGGLHRGDYVTSFNGERTPNAHALIERLQKTNGGDQINLHLTRDDWERDLKITLGTAKGGASAPEKKAEAPANEGGSLGERGFLGVYLKANPEGAGAFVDGVEPDSPAAKSSLKKGDVITDCDGKPVKDDAQMREILKVSKPGTKFALRVARDGWTRDVNVELGRRPGDRAPPAPQGKPAEPAPAPSSAAKKPAFLGVSLVDAEGKGPLKVDDVLANSPAEKAGIKPGDALVAIGDKKTATIKDFEEAMRAHFAGEDITVSIEREGGWTRQLKVSLGEKPAKE
jgi:S1-C subfamily serine protease